VGLPSFLKEYFMGKKDILDVLAETADGAFALDRDARILLWNPAAERITGRAAAEVIGSPCCEVMQGRDLSGNTVCVPGCHIQAMSLRGALPASYDLLMLHASGKRLWLNISTILVHNDDGELNASVHLFRDVTSRRELAAHLKETLGQELRNVDAPPDRLEVLTPREREVLRLITRGLPATAIANRLSISRATVRNHTQNILSKLGVHSKLAAVAMANRHGLF
jgi:PAS domain S-box-containing protein